MDINKGVGLVISFVLVVLVGVVIANSYMNSRYSDAYLDDNRQLEADVPPVRKSDEVVSKSEAITQTRQRIDNSLAADPIDFRLLVLSAQDQKAVVLSAQGQTQLLTIGDRVGKGGGYEVLQVAGEKLVLKHQPTGSTYWLFEGEGNDKGRVQAFSPRINEAESPTSPTVIELKDNGNEE